VDIDLLAKVISEVSDPKKPRSVGEPCDPVTGKCGGKKRKWKKKRKWNSVFPILYPSSMGTPKGFKAGSANDSMGPSDGAAGGDGATGGMASEGIRPSKAKVIHEMKKSLGLFEYFSNHSWSSSPNPAWGGYSVSSFGAVKMRGGGPTIGGPGFYHDDEFKGGKYDLKKSPGLGFRTENAWRIWDKVLEIVAIHKTMPKHAVLMRAMAKSGIHRGQLDPSEIRLLEMGIEWYLTDPGSLGAQRGGESPLGGTSSGQGSP
jgi:hypothetical protein